jgi:N utilization substance protein B
MKKKYLIVVADYYKDIAKGLLDSALKLIPKSNTVKIIKVPGVFEIPVTISKNIKRYDAFLALGCVIKGQTPHFDFISQASTNAIMDLSVINKKPIGNGIITCLNMKQAKIRRKKGAEAADAVNFSFIAKMKTHFNPKNNPRVIIIQKLYGKFYNEDNDIDFPKHRFKKFIKDIVFGTIERNDLILDELNTKLGDDFVLDNLDKVFQTILKAATYEFLYKPNISINIIIKEYLNSSNFFLEDSQTKYLNALLDNVGKKLRTSNA